MIEYVTITLLFTAVAWFNLVSILYAVAAKWWQTPAGRMTWVSATSVAMLLNLEVAEIFGLIDGEGFWVIFVMASINIAGLLKLGWLVEVQLTRRRKGRASE